LKSEGRRSVRLHFSHSAIFLTFPLSKTVFILISPPQEQKNFWVALVVRAFLLAWAIINSPCHIGRLFYAALHYPQNSISSEYYGAEPDVNTPHCAIEKVSQKLRCPIIRFYIYRFTENL
jgi:hypothetical protein